MKYIIESENKYYNTLRELKDHIWLQSDQDKKAYNGLSIFCYKGDNYIGCKAIKITGLKVIFSRTIKAQSFE